MVELLPCPFCGGTTIPVNAVDKSEAQATFYAFCLECRSQGPKVTVGVHIGWSTAIEAWNRRVGHQLDGDPPPALER